MLKALKPHLHHRRLCTYENTDWANMPSSAQSAASTLGYSQSCWDSDCNCSTCNKDWNELSSSQRSAASVSRLYQWRALSMAWTFSPTMRSLPRSTTLQPAPLQAIGLWKRMGETSLRDCFSVQYLPARSQFTKTRIQTSCFQALGSPGETLHSPSECRTEFPLPG